jgi:hypothetical protein
LAGQRHIIRRQVLEFRIADSSESFALQQEMARIYNEEIVPLLDEYLSAYSSPDIIDKIGRLELDLGVLDKNDLRSSFVRKAEAQLAEQLPELMELLERRRSDDRDVERLAAMHSSATFSATEENHVSAQTTSVLPHAGADRYAADPQGKDALLSAGNAFSKNADSRASDAELLGFYLQTGRFPWWARENGYGVLENTIQRLLEQRPEDLRVLLTKLLRQPIAAKRLVFSFRDELLMQLIQHYLAEEQSAAVRKLFGRWNKLSSLRENVAETREMWWQLLLRHVFIRSASREIPQTLLRRFSEGTGLSLAGRLAGLGESITVFGIRRDMESLRAAQKAVKALKKKPGTEVAADPDALQSEAERAIAQLVRELMPSASADEVAGTDFIAANAESEPKQDRNRSVTVPAGDKTADAFRFSVSGADPGEKLYNPFSESDHMYIHNAGLVLLSGLLPHYFDKAGLLDENRQWKNDTCRSKACILLQFLATGSRDFPLESDMTLGKIFCGIPEELPVDTHYCPTKKEQRLANELLRAVIQHWPKLGDSSPDALRGNFIVRPGTVSERDGHWLVRVEKRPFDLLLNDFAWNFKLIKFPWNPYLITVEWPY